MNEQKAALGVVAQVRDVPTSGVTRIVVEIPIENHVEATRLFYGKKVLVVHTSLDMKYGIVGDEEAKLSQQSGGEGAKEESKGEEKLPPLGPLALSAVKLCKEESFQRFASDYLMTDEVSEKVARAAIMEMCDVASRREIDTKDGAPEKLAHAMSEYRAFLMKESKS